MKLNISALSSVVVLISIIELKRHELVALCYYHAWHKVDNRQLLRHVIRIICIEYELVVDLSTKLKFH